MSALQRIFEPIRIGRVTIPNRVVRTAHGTSMSHPGINEDLIAYHVARAEVIEPVRADVVVLVTHRSPSRDGCS